MSGEQSMSDYTSLAVLGILFAFWIFSIVVIMFRIFMVMIMYISSKAAKDSTGYTILWMLAGFIAPIIALILFAGTHAKGFGAVRKPGSKEWKTAFPNLEVPKKKK